MWRPDLPWKRGPRTDSPRVVVAVDFSPPPPARHSRRPIVIAGLAMAATAVGISLFVTQLLLR